MLTQELDRSASVMHEVKGGRRFEHLLVPVTALAFLLPRFGHLYMLDEAARKVRVWTGRALQYEASPL